MPLRIDDVLAIARNIPWDDVAFAKGAAHVAVVRGLELLASADSDSAAVAAYNMFENAILVQGTLYEAALFAAPLLISMLDTDVPDKALVAVYELLFEIGNGSASHLAVARADWVDGRIPYMVPSANAPALPLQVHCRSIIAAAAPRLVQGIGDQRQMIHEKSLEILGSLNGYAGMVNSAIIARLEALQLPDSEVRRSIYKVVNKLI